MTATGMDKKKVMILAGLGLALLAVVVRFILSGAGGSSASASGSGRGIGAGRKPVGLLDSNPHHLETVAKIARARSNTVYTGGDARDPMVPLIDERKAPKPQRHTEPAARVEVRLPPMSLYGIIWDPENPIAMIDGMDLRVGDRIEGARIVEIGFDRVVFSYRSKRFVLTVA